MLFNSLEFIIFLPTVFVLYWLLAGRRRIQNVCLLLASYVFYGWWDWRFLLLISLTSACSYASGLWMERTTHRRAVCTANIVLNLAVLGVFKYYNFFVGSIVELLAACGIELDWVTVNLVLPVGISFYTFQALSYSIDVYRGTIRPTRDVVAFFSYISFFPQLVAGPIERASHLLPQFLTNRRFDYPLAVDGLRQMLWGFFKKMVVADGCAFAVNTYWNDYAELSGLQLVLLGVLFSSQIYADFSGYSDIAIGCARLFGFDLCRNFRFPYFSTNIREFWQRWHISLTTWLRDYVYFPLGGSRGTRFQTLRNTLIVFLVSGLWHGANWTFVCWGLYHAVLVVLCPRRVNAWIGRILTFTLVCIGFIVFRAQSLGEALGYLTSVVSNPFVDSQTLHGKSVLLFACVMLMAEWLQRRREHALQLSSSGIFAHRAVRWALYWTILLCIGFNLGTQQTFIYFQF